MLEWVQRSGLDAAGWPVSAYPQVDAIIATYADRDIDVADAALIWLAIKTGVRAILTIDIKDFAVCRLTGAKRFDVIDWRA